MMVEAHAFLQKAHCVVSADTTPHAKPHPAPLLHACTILKIQPNHGLFIGDAHTDMEAAIRAGMTAVLAAYGYGADQPHPEWVPDHIVSHSNDLLRYLRTWQPLSNHP